MNEKDQDSKPAKGIQLPQLSLPKGGGAISGMGSAFENNFFTGTASCSLSFPVTSARGFDPSITLQYNSGSGNSEFGMGFSLALPSICIDTSKTIPRYQGKDQFTLSSSGELVKIEETPTGSHRVIRYRPRVDSDFSKIEQWVNTATGESYWKVTDKCNVITYFGQTDHSRIFNPDNKTQIFEWLIDESRDAKGNAILYHYKEENDEKVPAAIYEENRKFSANRYLSRVHYGNYFVGEGVERKEKFAFEVVFDYGEYDLSDPATAHTPRGAWAYRDDAFSSYKSGFEIRTCRLCRHILLFHHFKAELGDPLLVQALRLQYTGAQGYLPEGKGALSLLRSAQLKGYRKNDLSVFSSAEMPEQVFNYSFFNPPAIPSFQTLTIKEQPVPGYLDAVQFLPVDLYGEGLPGLLYSNDTTAMYMEPEGGGAFSAPQTPAQFPINKNIQQSAVSLVDIDGNGIPEIVLNQGPGAGYYEQSTGRNWKNFKPFASYPLGVDPMQLEFADLDADGRQDLLLPGLHELLVYHSLGKKGYAAAMRVPNEHAFPLKKIMYPQESVWFGDMFGDGLSHRVRVTRDAVECWPCLGFGRYGRKVSFGNAPRFGDDFDSARLFNADIDGSGTQDLIYVYPDHIAVYFNLNGNSFSDAVNIKLPEIYTQLARISFADILGNGTSCLVFTKMNPSPVHYWYNFTGINHPGAEGLATKPYLLTGMDNNMGTTSQIQYASSTKFYLADKKAGKPWQTRLPFPVQVVERILVRDEIGGTSTVNRFSYHDGYYDPVEKSFCGFGYVESWDTEDFETYEKRVKEEGISPLEKAQYVAPVYTKTWYVTGCPHLNNDRTHMGDAFKGDHRSYEFPDNFFDPSIGAAGGDAMRQAYYAIKGQQIRREVYAEDGSHSPNIPYTVDEANVEVTMPMAPAPENPFAVFVIYPLESISYTYERNAADPRVQQQFTIEKDLECGLPSKTCTISLPRRIPLETASVDRADTLYQEQTTLKAILSSNDYINTDTIVSGYWKGLSWQEQQFELRDSFVKQGLYLSIQEVRQKALTSLQHIIPYGEEWQATGPQARQISWTRRYFCPEYQQQCNDFLPATGISPQGLVHHEESACFTNVLLKSSFSGNISPDTITDEGGYIFDDASKYWWNKGLVQFYFDKSQPDRFYQPYRTENCFAAAGSSLRQRTDLDYGTTPYYFLPEKMTSYVNETVTLETRFTIDYQAFQYQQAVDANDSVSQVLFDPLGNVIASTVFGTEDGVPTGGMRLYEYQGEPAEYKVRTTGSTGDAINFCDVLNHPEYYLQGVNHFYYYNLHGWTGAPPASGRQPVCSIDLVAENYFRSSGPAKPFACQQSITYNDGFGRTVEKKQLAASKNLSKKRINQAIKTCNDQTEQQWVASGRTVYDNKANPCQQYLNFYTNTPFYIDREQLSLANTVAPTVTFYDPLSRPVQVINPKGFFSKVEFTSWFQKMFDENDTVKDSAYFRDFMAAYKKDPKPSLKEEYETLLAASEFYNTPTIQVLDNDGNTIRIIQDLKTKLLVSKQGNDIMGRVTEMIDPRLNSKNELNKSSLYNFRYRYMMGASDAYYVDSADAGKQVTLFNIYGNQCWSYSARNYCQLTGYDRLQRQATLRVLHIKVPGKPVPASEFPLLEVFTYGDELPGAKDKNLRGRLVKVQDLSGMMNNSSYSLLGDVLQTSRQLVKDYDSSPDWRQSVKMATGIFEFKYSYNALKQQLTQSTPDSSVTATTYNKLGLPQSIRTLFRGQDTPVIDNIVYDANFLRLQVDYGNKVSTVFTLEATTQRVLGLFTRRPGSNKGDGTDHVLQDITYTYDPVGNVTFARDNSSKTIYHNNKVVEPLSTYQYDATYRLVSATGRKHPGVSGGSYRNNRSEGSFKQSRFINTAVPNDMVKLEPYREKFKYDDSDNLIEKQHIASKGGYTTLTPVQTSNNWLTKISITDLPDALVQYDASGNQQSLFINNAVPLVFNCCENLVKAGMISRPGQETDDAEYYLYDYTDTRARKITVRKQVLTELTEKIYLGNYEVKRIITVDAMGNETVKLERQTLRVMDGEDCAVVLHYWEKDDTGREVKAAGDRSVRFQLGDIIGSVAVEVDDRAKLISYEEYFPYGGTSFVAGDNEKEVDLKDYRYSGKECDDTTGLYYYGARYYISWLGRWLNADPAGDVDGPNLFSFVGGNPITCQDGNGMSKKAKVAGAPKSYSQSGDATLVSPGYITKGNTLVGETAMRDIIAGNKKSSAKVRVDGHPFANTITGVGLHEAVPTDMKAYLLTITNYSLRAELAMIQSGARTSTALTIMVTPTGDAAAHTKVFPNPADTRGSLGTAGQPAAHEVLRDKVRSFSASGAYPPGVVLVEMLVTMLETLATGQKIANAALFKGLTPNVTDYADVQQMAVAIHQFREEIKERVMGLRAEVVKTMPPAAAKLVRQPSNARLKMTLNSSGHAIGGAPTAMAPAPAAVPAFPATNTTAHRAAWATQPLRLK